MPDRQGHQEEVRLFLNENFSRGDWELNLPRGTGNETYFARGGNQSLFVKLNVHAERYRVAASIGLTPPVLAAGSLEDGTSIIVQPFIPGKRPARSNYRAYLGQFASTIRDLHHCDELKGMLPRVRSDLYSMAGLEVLDNIRKRWEGVKSLVPDSAGFVDESLRTLQREVAGLKGSGLVASHNDICNANWLLSEDGSLYLIDLDSMSLDDPALDIGATLWWYYPPELREEFLDRAGYSCSPEFKARMRVRMAMHCLHILLPREGSFDEFDPVSFEEWLPDFRAAFAGEENPEGYDD